MFTASSTSVRLTGPRIAGVHDRHLGIPGFDQDALSRAHVLCIGAGGLMSYIAPTLARKGVGAITLLDHDVVEVSNLNRQRFYEEDIGEPKAVAFAQHLQQEALGGTTIVGHPVNLQEAIEGGIDLGCDIAICGVDNNPTRVDAARYFRQRETPVIFCAVSARGDHGYAFVQERSGPCFGCLFPDAMNDGRYPCPNTPAIAEILQAVGSLVVYAVDSLLMDRPRAWTYRSIRLSDGSLDAAFRPTERAGCPLKHDGLPRA